MTENLKYQNGTFDLSQVQRTQNEYADIYKVTNSMTLTEQNVLADI